MRCLSLYILLVSSSFVFAKAPVIGFINLHPHINDENAKISGYLVDYLDYVFEGKSQEYFTLKRVPFNRALYQIKNKQLGGFLTLIETPERKEFVTYLKNDLLLVSGALCSLKDLAKKDRYVVSHVAKTVIPAELKTEKYSLSPLHGKDFLARSIKMVLTKRVDYIYHPEATSLVWTINEMNQIEKFSCIKTNTTQRIGIGFSKGVSASLIKKIEAKFNNKKSYNSFLKEKLANITLGKWFSMFLDDNLEK